MYIIGVIFLGLLSTCYGCRPPPCHWKDPTPAVNYFKQVAHKVIEADKKQQGFCQKNGAFVKEEHTPTSYSLKMPMSYNNLEVKVQNRVLMVLPVGCLDSSSVWDVRVLPTYVDGYSGHYCVDGGMLTITFPYKYNPLTGGGYTCEALRKDTVTLSPVASPNLLIIAVTPVQTSSCGAFGCTKP